MKAFVSYLVPHGCKIAAVVALGLIPFWGREKGEVWKGSTYVRKVKAFSETLILVLIIQYFSHTLLTAGKFKKLSILGWVHGSP